MPIRIRRADRARERAQLVRQRIGADVRRSRHGAGISIERAAAAVGLSPSVFGRIERGVLDTVTVEQLCLACESVGLQFNGRAYPAGSGVRDAGHGRLLERFHARLPAGAPWRTEVGLPIPGDLRAWDAMTVLERVEIAIEAEMRLTDAQSLDRRLALKRRDSGIAIVICCSRTRARTVRRSRRIANRCGLASRSTPVPCSRPCASGVRRERAGS